ncbi:MFS transporter [Uliginosibacterium sediminicola]|uniref:MFS transporter n=1 Tax=Uliginosibacterium sediminicola TaxID=2024550 RepID=A0ABU9YUS6_9RHOO
MQIIAMWARTRIDKRFHYAWVAVAVSFLVMLITAATRATPSIMMVPLEQDFGWTRSSISLALSINLALFGLMGPFAAAAMERFGLRRTVLCALSLLATAVALSNFMQQSWQMSVLWGVIVGCSTGATAMTLGATVVSRWFKARRGLAMGILTASTATGQLIFLPTMASIVAQHGWRPVVLIVAAAIAVVVLVAFLFLPERPADLGLPLYGEPDDAPLAPPEARKNLLAIAFGALGRAVKQRDFWLLFFSFFVCGASTNGYIGTHFIAMCGDYGLDPVKGASILAAMGALDLVGTTLSGWLSDRFNNRVLLFWYYGLRGLALIYLPYAFGLSYFGLPVFALFYGLDWIATVPPTVRLTNDVFGSRDAPIVFGWIVAGHQLGAAFAALLAGVLRNSLGSYTVATMISGGLCLAAAVTVLRIHRRGPLASPVVAS